MLNFKITRKETNIEKLLNGMYIAHSKHDSTETGLHLVYKLNDKAIRIIEDECTIIEYPLKEYHSFAPVEIDFEYKVPRNYKSVHKENIRDFDEQYQENPFGTLDGIFYHTSDSDRELKFITICNANSDICFSIYKSGNYKMEDKKFIMRTCNAYLMADSYEGVSPFEMTFNIKEV